MQHQDLNDFGVHMMDAACLFHQLEPEELETDEELHESISESLRLMSNALDDLKDIMRAVNYVDDGYGSYALSTYIH